MRDEIKPTLQPNVFSPMSSARLLQPDVFSPSSSARSFQPEVFSPKSSAPSLRVFSPNFSRKEPVQENRAHFGAQFDG